MSETDDTYQGKSLPSFSQSKSKTMIFHKDQETSSVVNVFDNPKRKVIENIDSSNNIINDVSTSNPSIESPELGCSLDFNDVQVLDIEVYEDYPIFEEEKDSLIKLYHYMMKRKALRKKNVNKDQSKSQLTSTTLSLILFLDFLHLYINMVRLNLFSGFYEYYVLVFLFSFLLMISMHYSNPILIYLFTLLYIFIYCYTLISNILITGTDESSNKNQSKRWYGFIVPLIFVLFLGVIFYMWIYPLLYKLVSSLLKSRFSIRKIVSKKTQKTKYEFDHGKYLFMINEFDQNNLNRTSGFGTWIDNSFHGERLEGYFDNAIPVGPFHSVESKTPNIFKSIRIIFASNSGGKLFIEKTKLGYGVASVECCVSGTFYKHYPLVHYIAEKKECNCRKRECFCITNILKNHLYFHLEENKPVSNISVMVDQKENCLFIPGYYSKHAKKRKEVTITVKDFNNEKTLEVDSHWIKRCGSVAEGNIEVLLFIHGLDHTLYDALRRMGQMLALGNFPQHILPLVFNWPSSQNAACYYCAANNACDRNQHRDFFNFLKSLQNAGVKRIHIMCHSLGSKFFMQSYLLVQSLFKKVSKSSTRYSTYGTSSDISEGELNEDIEQGNIKMEFANLILLNSDYEVETFVEDYNELKERCEHITIYADQRDSALHVSNFLTKKERLGARTTPLEYNGEVLDKIDIIDTSELDRNINEARHGFFNINKMMIDDLFDIIVNSKPASSRVTRLVNINGTYRFSLLPSFSQMRFSQVEQK
ncbi:hypothetical protein ENUP19_0339G0008 [Entamoeba nuttalli]|uniref:Uncharacterized protein n=2 Tax=Entamoeba nuttalli TaxID=412467 RepID=K2HI93_ENTNP|nr:hypothetical protein ENU1_013240 [Entamoeba nuttalli P19]EKE42709.1 hypothetical protein ENU1_013240 [Entamoeba nuttalli P19]|eukprot:XP_008854960.1 hypothetical protein ENU1_013240 [Entamoeba nuttalli P19]